ncbi:MAG: 5'-3' exonuclease H3TH domain-containing protein [Gemmatimonadota bacterium]
MHVHLIDGTYELFRHFYAMARSAEPPGGPYAGVAGVLRSVLGLLEGGATHVGVATDHVIESFRNELWSGYKTGDGMDPALYSQFHPLEDALRSMGVVVWAMEEFEADDALASAAWRAAADDRVEQVLICTPDKDLCQCVVGQRIVQLDRRQRQIRDEAGVVEKFGVLPTSIPDWLALVGDSADGFPGLPGWGAKASAAVLARYRHIEAIPPNAAQWAVPVRGAERLSEALETHRELAMLFKTLATLRADAPVFGAVDELRWSGPNPEFEQSAAALGAAQLWDRARSLARAS